MKTLIACLLILSTVTVQAAIYRWVDADGNVHFSDQPTNEAKKIELSPTTVYSPVGTSTAPANSSRTDDDAAPVSSYSSFTIAAPANRETVIANDGRLTVQFQSTPPLQSGHYIQLVHNGRLLNRRYSSQELTLEELTRGSHMIHASIYNRSGGLMKRSNIVQFFVRRETLLDDPNPADPPPPTDLSGGSDKFGGSFDQNFNAPGNNGGDQFGTNTPPGDKFQTTNPPGDKFQAPN